MIISTYHYRKGRVLLSLLLSLMLVASSAWAAPSWRDGDGDERRPRRSTDADGDGFSLANDCNDSDPTVYPGALEIANDGIDQDCNGYDLTIQVTRADYLVEKDAVWILATSALAADAALTIELPWLGTRTMSWNSDKGRWQRWIGDPTGKGFDPANPGTVLISGVEGAVMAPIDGGSVPVPPCTDADGDGYTDATCGGSDCNDLDPTVFPGAIEIAGDGIDQDCNGVDLASGGGNPDPDNGGGGSGPHANLTYAGYPGNCLSCHARQAGEMMQTTHYRWIGETPDMVNAPGSPQGKLTNAVNSYCINIQGDWPVCGSCHVGRGQRPDAAGSGAENVDCLMCHNDTYAGQRTRLPDGSLGVAQPDDSLVQNIHRPTRANCLACHAKAGGGDAVKRGDLSLATITNTDPAFDVHMNSAGANLACQSCHVFENHKVIGKGSDLRPTDDTARGSEVSCLTCHTDKASREGHDTAKINDHVARVACQTCHIPVYAKVATETYRDWRFHHDGSPADATAVAGHPYTEKLANLTPTYKFWNRKSDNALLGDDARRTYNTVTDTWPTSIPTGNVSDGKLYPFKYKTAMQPKTVADDRLIALNTFEYLKATGNVDSAIAQGLGDMGYPADEPYEWVLTDTYQLLNHGINPSTAALQCANCHGSIDRMDLQGDLGYQLNGERSTVCFQCHGQKENKSFAVIHDKHVRDKKYDCSNCHTFSRPERGLAVR